MRSYLLGAAAALGLFPVMASAVVSVNGDRLEVIPGAAQQTVYIDVFGVDVDNTDERLNTYTIAVNAPLFSGTVANMPRFQIPAGGTGSLGSVVRPSPAHPFVFGGLETIPPIESFGSTPSRLQFASNAIEQTDEVNLGTTRNGFIRLPIIVPANAAPGIYNLNIERVELAGLGAPIVGTIGTSVPTLVIVPEPASLGLVGLGGLLMLRRRRVA